MFADSCLPSNFDVLLFVQCARVILDTNLMQIWNIFLEVIYKNFDLLCRSEEVAAVLIEGCLLRDSFEVSFLSWSVATRWTFFQVVAAAVSERPDWKALVMRKIDGLDATSPYLDLDTFKDLLSEFSKLGDGPLPMLQPLPPKPSIAKYGITFKEVAGSSNFKD